MWWPSWDCAMSQILMQSNFERRAEHFMNKDKKEIQWWSGVLTTQKRESLYL